MRLGTALVAAALAALSACAPLRDVRLTGRDHFSGWPDQIREAAVEAYAYAQMSANADSDQASLDLPPPYRMLWGGGNDALGFSFWVFERRSGDRLEEVVLAFTGRKPKRPKGWAKVDLLARRNALAFDMYDRLRGQNPPSVRITVIGNALGGEIAIEVVRRRPDARSYIFNWPSSYSVGGSRPAGRRLSVAEHAGGPKVVRVRGDGAPQIHVSIPCRRGSNALGPPDIRLLAACLTRIAAFESAEARGSLDRNRIPRPPGLPRP